MNWNPSGRVLLVDDSSLVLEFLEEELQEVGWEVFCAQSGTEAIETARWCNPDVVICDLHMPDMDGYEVLQRLHTFASDLPVVIHSADSDLSAVLNAVRRGAFDYVLKSSGELDPLFAAIERAVRHAKVVRENRRLAQALQDLNSQLEEHNAELDSRNATLNAEISERKLAQEALSAAHLTVMAASRSKSAFLASMSHELRTPLTAILGYADLDGIG